MLKSVIIAAGLMLAATAAQAQNIGVGSSSSSESYSNSNAGSTSSVTIKNSRGYRQTGTAIAPGLIAGGITCQGSASVGAGGPGWGFSFGSTKMDSDCNTRENAKMVALMGERDAAREVMCGIEEVRAAFKRVGRPCIVDGVYVSHRPIPTKRGKALAYSAPRGQVTRVSALVPKPAAVERRPLNKLVASR